MEPADLEIMATIGVLVLLMALFVAGEPLYRRYGLWKERRAFRLREQRDAFRNKAPY